MTELRHHTLNVNDIHVHVAEQGSGPLVLLVHGWPELGLSWRHQIPALAAAGCRVMAPDMRGFGRSQAPAEVSDYSIMHLVGDLVALVAAAGERDAVVIGHDWGATIAWHAALFRPDLFRAVACLSVPFRSRGPAPPLRMLRAAGQHGFYWLYFQEPGVAEAEFERDPEVTLRRILYSGSGDRPSRAGGAGILTVPEGGGFLTHTLDPETLPPWLDGNTLRTMAAEYRRTGFRGGLNYYRNIDRNWKLTAPWQGARIRTPALYIGGTRDPVIRTPTGQAALEALPELVPGLRDSIILEGCGHWIQQERPEAVNLALLKFLAEL
jgi:pimeloyl-ACP methyl ester carboxylesterase